MSRLWTNEEIKKLQNWSKQKFGSHRDICKEVNRSWDAVRHKLERMELPIPLESSESVPSGLKTEDDKRDQVISHLQTQVKELTERKKIFVHNFFEKRIRIGIVSDSHMGSLYERLDILEAAYDCFKREGISRAYHPGDLCEGEKMHRGQEYEIAVHGADAQATHCVKNYPYRKGITTYFITGSHDLSFWKRSGIDIGERIAEKREDMVYLGKESADVLMGKGKNRIQVELVHPGKGTAYAMSYHPQKHIEALSGGQKPHIVLMGHYHKAEMLPSYRNVFLIQAGCSQSQTPFMRRNNLAAHLGYWILDFTIAQPHLISRFKAEFFAIYEDKEIALEV